MVIRTNRFHFGLLFVVFVYFYFYTLLIQRMEGSDYCITVEDAVVVLELIIDDIPPEGKSDGHMNVDEHSSTEISAKPTEITKNIENDTTLRSSELANESVSTNTPSASVSGGPTTSTPRSVVDIIDSISRTLAGR
jgi:hypothetical protein